ncbi:MAG TPA: hypothetical protein PKH07_20815, partial [bacterium]|nr:hypothetical protein [bacterium]
TWNWGGFRNCQAFTSVFPSPRISCIVTAAPDVVKMAFLDNLYLNVMPRKTESVNGSDWIYNYPAMSEALKECAALRSQFLEYFTEGRFIGDNLLSESCPNAHVAAYIRPNKALLLLLNRAGKRSVEFKCNLAPWIDSKDGKYIVKGFDSNGKQTQTRHIESASWTDEVSSMEPLGIALFEISSDGNR